MAQAAEGLAGRGTGGWPRADAGPLVRARAPAATTTITLRLDPSSVVRGSIWDPDRAGGRRD